MAKMACRDGNKARREDRKIQAGIRRTSYDGLTTAQKLARLTPIHNAGGAKKQWAKLTTLVVREHAAKKKEAA